MAQRVRAVRLSGGGRPSRRLAAVATDDLVRLGQFDAGTDPDGNTLWHIDGWRVRCEVESDGGALRIRELHLTPASTGQPSAITARLLKSLQLGVHYGQAQREIGGNADLPVWGSTTLAEWLAPSPGTQQRGEARLHALALIASEYVRIYQGEGALRINAKVAARLGLSAEKVRDRVYAARVEGLLSPDKVGRGQAGGELTDKAIQLLANLEVTS